MFTIQIYLPSLKGNFALNSTWYIVSCNKASVLAGENVAHGNSCPVSQFFCVFEGGGKMENMLTKASFSVFCVATFVKGKLNSPSHQSAIFKAFALTCKIVQNFDFGPKY